MTLYILLINNLQSYKRKVTKVKKVIQLNYNEKQNDTLLYLININDNKENLYIIKSKILK